METLGTHLQNWWNNFFSEDYLVQWVIVVPTFFLAYGLIFILYRTAQRIVAQKKNHRPWLEFIDAFFNTSHWPFFLAFSIYVALLVSPIPYEFKSIFNKIFGVAIIVQVGLWLNTILHYFFTEVLSKGADASKTTVLRAVSVVAKMLLWLGIFLLLLDNIGVNITTLVAGLGVGGIAVALGTQKIVGDIFASLSIVMDKPFVIGDFITVGEYKGTVEDIGIKTTRIRSLTGERIVFANSDLLDSRIKNFTQMHNRRVEFTIGITYETPLEKVRMASKLIEEAVKSVENTRFQCANLNNFATSSLDFIVVYWINDPSYDIYLATQENICLKILEAFNKNKIDFAYPTRRQIVEQIKS